MGIFVPNVCVNCGKQVYVNIDTETGLIDLRCPGCKKLIYKSSESEKKEAK